MSLTRSASLLSRDLVHVSHLQQLIKLGTVSEPSAYAGPISIPATNLILDYVVNIGIGNPPTNYSLLVDTGSSNTWVGASKAYVKTSTSVQTNDSVSVFYGTGSFGGTEFTDTVTLASGLVITNQSIGVANSSEGFPGVDGIMGIGPTDLTLGTLSPDTQSTIPTITDNLFSQGTIPRNLVAISFEPTTAANVINGELTFGGTDPRKFTGDISYAPLSTTPPASTFWGIDESITYGTSGINILNETAGIVDTGTTLLLIASDAAMRYQQATGAVLDNSTGLFRLTPSQFANLQSLFFHINGVTHEFPANAQAVPRALNEMFGGTNDYVYLVVSDIGTLGGGLGFIMGQAFLERFYTVFDTTNKRLGFATTPFTNATMD
ncbi:uncharacterized protein PHACADRAFT_107685 [Phanerochaete carnosa HHB-10118-sp]|uniref:Peptidase A1 domain-containing protein n=1 Tax=Phanerochaete carnosa (strain HHB-10118-sp) TaxID=650164 RepID=K5VR32_PHACS|nr:uncharacterized protein PHACADRAFT_107685 [Phanerochaete carnosa HHB-10118-sp]EKM49034.1 hypothetical protein PHACADRAFT_107685 [Phanerochaete carnosa HHB-10118-sp]